VTEAIEDATGRRSTWPVPGERAPGAPGSQAPACPETGHRAALPAGTGRLAFALVDGATALVGCEAASPLQILVPRARGTSAWAFVVGHGGGLVAGDHIDLEVEVGAGASALLATQAETKVYRAVDGRGARQRLHARLAAGAVLAVLPEPLSPFAGARLDQRQRFDLEAGSSLVALDAVVAGRTARGERWAFERHRTSSEVRIDGRLVVADALVLEPRRADAGARAAPGGTALAERLGGFDAFATALALGPAFSAGARALLARLAQRPVEAGAAVLAAASPLADGLLLRCGARSPEALAAFLREALAFTADVLGGDPFSYRW
jgi:urease accessory protein